MRRHSMWAAVVLLGVTLGCDRRKENTTCAQAGLQLVDAKKEKGPALALQGGGEAPACLVVTGTWSPSADDVGITAVGDPKEVPMRGFKRWALLYKVDFQPDCVGEAAPPAEAAAPAPVAKAMVDGAPVAKAQGAWAAFGQGPVCFTSGACQKPVSVELKLNDDHFPDNMNTGALCAGLLPEAEARALQGR